MTVLDAGEAVLELDRFPGEQVTVWWATDWTAGGEVHYTMRGRWLTGVIRVRYTRRTGDPDPYPRLVAVSYGDPTCLVRYYYGQAQFTRDIRWVDTPVVYGAHARGGRVYSDHLEAYPATPDHMFTHPGYADKARARLAAVVRAIVAHWAVRPDREQLRTTAAALDAVEEVGRLDDQMHMLAARIDRLTAQYVDLKRQRSRFAAVAGLPEQA